MVGAGCASCGAINQRYDYDQQGRLVGQTRITVDGQPLEAQRSELDAQGRIVRQSRIAYVHGKAQPEQWLTRYEYADAEQAQPALIATPGIIEGKEHQIRISYNEAGQPLGITESGYSPVDDKGQADKDGAAISRSTTYTYQRINGRSLPVRIDGPLKSGDGTRINWDQTGNYITTTTAPGDLKTTEERDRGTGRLTQRTDPAGIRTRYEYAVSSQSRPSLIERAGQTTTYTFDALGHVAQVSDGAARSIKLHYDRAEHLIAVTDAQGYRAQTTLDAEGQALIAGLYEPERNEPLRATYRWYDEQRRITRQLRADGRIDTWRYDSAGDVSERTDGDDVLHLKRTSAQGMQASIDMAPDGLINVGLWSAEPNQAGPIGAPQVRRDDFGRAVLEWRPGQRQPAWPVAPIMLAGLTGMNVAV